MGAITFILTAYYKMAAGKGLFMLNPCHISLLGVIVLCVAPSTARMHKLHTMWTSWLFGAFLALFFPHLRGISDFEVYLYFLEHLLIIPIGPIILFRRYDFVKPNFKNQFAAFASLGIYQCSVLFFFSVLTSVNLNFALCHSPSDPFFAIFGKWYFPFAMFYLNFGSWMSRWVLYLMVYPLRLIRKKIHEGSSKD